MIGHLPSRDQPVKAVAAEVEVADQKTRTGNLKIQIETVKFLVHRKTNNVLRMRNQIDSPCPRDLLALLSETPRGGETLQ